jgi:hypothetical protein
VSYPWWGIQRERELRESEELAKRWRTELVKIGEEVLQEMEKHGASKDVIERFRDFVDNARSAGFYKS